MKFFVPTVLERRDQLEISSDVFYIEDRIVQIGGVEYPVFYGDIIQHPDGLYYVNEDDIRTNRFHNQFDDMWYLENGSIPADGKIYFISVNPDIVYESQLTSQKQFANKTVKRIARQFFVESDQNSNLFYNDRPYILQDGNLVEYTKSYDTYNEINEQIRIEHLNSIKEDEEFREELVEKAAALIPVPADGKDGRDGEQGPRGASWSEG